MRKPKNESCFVPDKDDCTIVDAYLRSHGSSYEAWNQDWETKKEAAFKDLLIDVLHNNKEGVIMLIQDQSSKSGSL
jgi:hypothetical protein